MTDLMISRLEEEMKKQGFNYKSLSRAAGLGETSVRDIITRRALNPRRDTLQKIAVTLSKPVSYFLAEEHEAMVKVVGEIAPGAKLAMRHAGNVSDSATSVTPHMEMVETPPELGYRDLVALRVRGDALLPFMPNGTLIYYRGTSENYSDCLNALCVIQIKHGALVVKTLLRGLLYDTYNLQSHDGKVTENAEVEWCARIRFIKLP